MLDTVNPICVEEVCDEKKLFIVDSGLSNSNRLRRSFETLGFDVTQATNVEQAVDLISRTLPEFALIELRLDSRGWNNGLDVLGYLMHVSPSCRAVMISGHDSIASAVTAIKLGAKDFLAKPVDFETISRALFEPELPRQTPPFEIMTPNRVRWEYVSRVHELCGRNNSETARRLRMHRRTLQRYLAKHSPE